jgi:hypothetical protein
VKTTISPSSLPNWAEFAEICQNFFVFSAVAEVYEIDNHMKFYILSTLSGIGLDFA